MSRKLIVIGAVVVALALAAITYVTYFINTSPSSVDDVIAGVEKTFKLTSPVFSDNGVIPRKYTCDGEDVSPPLRWSGAPPETKSYVLIVYDPDAPKGTFYHWLLYNIPANLNSLPEGIPKIPKTEYGLQGINDFGTVGYGGPCPPTGSTHHYVFVLLALDTKLSISSGARIGDLLKAVNGHVIAYAKLTGVYGR